MLLVFCLLLGWGRQLQPVGAELCTNYFGGANRSTWCGDEGCCRDGESYAVDLDDDEICSDNGSCSHITSVPTSCLISVDGQEMMYGCGEGASCCQEQGKEFFYRTVEWEDVCAAPGMGCGRQFEVDWTVEREVQCYHNCTIINSLVQESTGADLLDLYIGEEYAACTADHVIKCGSAEVCLEVDFELGYGQPDPLSGDVYDILLGGYYISCAGEQVMYYQTEYCDVLVEEVEGRLTSPQDIRSYCAFQDVCEADCVDEDHRIGGFPTWAIILIVVLLLLVIVLVLVAVWCYFKQTRVQPATPKMVVTVEDPRTRRLRELDALLSEAIAARDMGNLQLATDAVEGEGAQEEMGRKYQMACELLRELLAREEEEKRRELEAAEREAAEAKRLLEEAEAELERRRRAEEEAARIREAERAAEAARRRWARLWPRLQVLRALNAVDAQAKEKAMEDARRAREEAERLQREEEERQRRALACKQLLRGAIKANTAEKLEEAIRQTEKDVFQTSLMEDDEELKSLYGEAREALDRLRREEEERRLQKQREEEARRAEEERRREEERRIAEEKRQAAMARLDEIRIILKRGIEDRNIELLKSGISQAESNYLQDDLSPDYERAKVLLERLQKIEKVKKNIMELKRPLIAELKSMASPPVPVVKAMTGAFLLMGERASYLREWNNIVILLNKTGSLSVKRRVQDLQVESVTEELARAAEDTMLGLTSDEVYEANQAASLFYDWADMICYEYKQLKEGFK